MQLVLAIFGAALLTSCVNSPLIVDPPYDLKRANVEAPAPANQATSPTPSAQSAPGVSATATSTVLQATATPRPPEAVRSTTVKTLPTVPPADARAASITVNLEQITLPSFIQTVYGNLLKRTFSLDPAVALRKDLVTFRAAKEQTAADLDRAATLVLKSYGVAAVDAGGLIRFVPDNAQSGYYPEIRRGRAMPDVPLPMRPVFQLVELEASRPGDISGVLRTMITNKIVVTDDGPRNALLISGTSSDITAAMEAIQVLDQPALRGRSSIRINPTFWPADELSKRLTDILSTEGYAVGGPNSNTPIMFVPVPAINALLVFAADPKTLSHVVNWATELDKPNLQGRPAGNGIFSYQVQNTDAGALSKVLSDLLSGGLQPVNTNGVPPGFTAGTMEQLRTAQAQAAAQQANKKQSRVVVDTSSNTLIFQGTNDEYSQLIPILRDLDRPARSAYVQVTVVRMNRSDALKLGVDWKSAVIRGGSGIAGGFGALPTSPKPPISQETALDAFASAANTLTVGRYNAVGDLTARLSANADDGTTKILSNPILVARNGEPASFQVGQDIAVRTSTQTTGVTTGIVESFQYRSSVSLFD